MEAESEINNCEDRRLVERIKTVGEAQRGVKEANGTKEQTNKGEAGMEITPQAASSNN